MVPLIVKRRDMNTRGNLGDPLKSLPTKDEDQLSKRRKPFQAGSPERAKKKKILIFLGKGGKVGLLKHHG